MNKLGIDFGTSFCTICALEDGKPKAIRVDGNDKIPTVVYWGEKDVVVGEAALQRWNDSFDLEEEEFLAEQARIIRSVKRKFKPKEVIPLPGGKSVTPQEVVAKVLAFLVKQAEELYFHKSVDEVTLTCPATFNQEQENMLVEAIKLANIPKYTLMEDKKFLKEPLSAAIAYTQLGQNPGAGILIYDLGGGTFDLSYVHHDSDGNWRIPLPTAGDSNCGGDDFDRIIYDNAKKYFQEKGLKFDEPEGSLNHEILDKCRELKEKLTLSEEASLKIIMGRNGAFKMARGQFEELIRDKLASTIQKTQKYLDEIKAKGYLVDSVILVGGSTAIPLVKTMLKDILPVEPLSIHDGDVAVAEGAALYQPQKDKIVEVPVEEYSAPEFVPPPKFDPLIEGLKATGSCPKCGKPIYSVQPEKQNKKQKGKGSVTSHNNDFPICMECGHILKPGQLPDIKREAVQQKLYKLVKQAQDVKVSSSALWSMTAQRYAKAVEQLKVLLKSDAFKDLNDLQKDSHTDDTSFEKGGLGFLFNNLERMEELCASRDYHIALVGTIKAGKSSLLNAIIGEELASTAVTPETASLTKFRSSDEGQRINVSFYTTKEWNDIWNSVNDAKESNNRKNVFLEEYKALNAEKIKSQYLDKPPRSFACKDLTVLKEGLLTWTSSAKPEHYFVKEVEVCLDSLHLPKQVVFVDTPGLDDIVEYRSNITRDYIKRANAVLVCVTSEAMSGPALEHIHRVFANCGNRPDKVFVLGTKIDILNKPQSDWSKQQDKWVEYLKETDFGSEDLARRHIIGVSSWVKKMLHQFDAGNKDALETLCGFAQKMGYFESLFEISKENVIQNLQKDGIFREKLLKFANIDGLMTIIRAEIIDNYKQLLVQDICKEFKLNKKELMNLMNRIHKEQDTFIETCKAPREEQKRKLAEEKKKFEQLQEEVMLEQEIQEGIIAGFKEDIKKLKDKVRNL